jgi:hypothetical protein
MAKNLKKEDNQYLEKMASDNTLTIWTLVVMVVVGRNEIFSFIQSFSQGLSSFLSSLPSILILVLLGLFIVILGKNKK